MAYYSDPLGKLLSAWRQKAVLSQVRGRLLDLGCGDNQLVRAYQDGPGLGADIADYGAGGVLVVEDLAGIPRPDGSFDTITIVACLNYFPRPDRVLAEAHRLLAPEGRLVLTMSNPALMRLWHRFREPWAHRPALSAAEIGDLLRGAGFSPPRARPFMLGINRLYLAGKG